MGYKNPALSRQKAEVAMEWFLKVKSVSDTLELGWLGARRLSDREKWKEIVFAAFDEATSATWEWHLDSGGKDINDE